jgi:hypothetical protein
MPDPKERWNRFVHRRDTPPKPTPERDTGPAAPEEKAPAVGVQQYTPTNRRNCKHPKEHHLVEVGPLVGRVVICRLCGSNVNDPDLAG